METKTRLNTCPYCKKEVDAGATKCPHCHSDIRNWFRRHWIISTFIGFILFSIIVSNFSSAKDKGQQVADLEKRQQEQVNTPAIFDISDLLGKSIDDVVAKFGQPKSKYIPKGNTYDGDNPDMTFEKDKLQMIVTYDLKSKSVIDFFLPSANDHSNLNSIEDKNIILNQLNLVDNSPNYEVKYVKALKDSNIFTGVIVKKIDPLASGKETAVERISKNLIKQSLKAPSTADFGYPSTKTTDSKTFVVSQSVDSQNSFGAMIKTHFDVTVKYIGEENSNAIYEDYNWKVMTVESDGEMIYKAK